MGDSRAPARNGGDKPSTDSGDATTGGPTSVASPASGAVAALALAGFCGALNVVVLGPFLPAISRELGVGIPLLGQAPALSNLLAALLGLGIGPLADRYGHRRALVVGLLAIAAGSLGTALSPTYLVFLVGVLLSAPGRSIAMPVAQAIAGGAFSGPARDRTIGWVQAGVGSSVTVGMPLLTAVDARFDWRAALVTFAALALAAAGLARATLPSAVPHAGATSRLKPRDLLAAYAPLFRHRPTIGLVASTVLGSTAISSLLTYIGAFLIEIHGMTPPEVGWAFSLSGVGLILGGLLGARLTARIRSRPLAMALLALRGVLIGAIFSQPFGGVAAALLFGLLGLGDGAYIVSVVLALTGGSPAGRATTMVLIGSATALGSAAGSTLGGLLLLLGGWPLLGLAAPLVSLAGAATVWWSGRGASRLS